jgi:hypothetical protein
VSNCGNVDTYGLNAFFFVQGSWGGYASSDQRSGNVKKFLSVVADMGLPGFSVRDLDEVRALCTLSHEIAGLYSGVSPFYFLSYQLI